MLLLPTGASAQEGSISYGRSVRLDFQLPPGREAMRARLPSESVSSIVLFFDEVASLSRVVPEAEDAADGQQNRMMGFLTRMRQFSTSRGDHETIVEAYRTFDDGTVTEAREFMGRTFLIAGPEPVYEWRLSGEQSKFLGFTVQKATVVQDSSTIEAWFTPEIPISSGPGPFSGLPGMILVISIDDGSEVYSATEVSLDSLAEGLIRAPQGGDEVSREAYEQIVVEKLKEVQTRSRARRRPRGVS